MDESMLALLDRLCANKQFELDGDGKNFVSGLDAKDIGLLKTAGVFDYVETLIGKFDLSIGMFLDARVPYQIHTDYTKPEDEEIDINVGMAVLVPLETKNTSTIIFNQQCEQQDLVKSLPDLPEHVDHKFWIKNLSHCNPWLRFKVSVKSVHTWTRGHPILWHRLQLHSSNNFLDKYENKRALVLFTNTA
jgi:hypothetical protein